MNRSDGLTRLWPGVVTLVAAVASLLLLAAALRSLPLGTAYAAWTGIGALGAFALGAFALGILVLGILVLGEPPAALRIGGALLIPPASSG